MEPFYHIIPAADKPTMTLALTRKKGGIPRGRYSFIEYYCTEPGCDCRRVLLIVFNENVVPKAVINFGFDQDNPFSGPYLDTSNKQSPFAHHLLDHFVHALNSNPEWLERLYLQYRLVREKVEGKRYSGKPFPKPGQLVYRVTPPPDLEAEIEQSLKELRASSQCSLSSRKGRKRGSTGSAVFSEESASATRKAPPAAAKGIAALVGRYAKLGIMGPIAKLSAARDALRRYLLKNAGAGDELAALLPALCRQSPEDDEKIDAALQLLHDSLHLLQQELEKGRPGAQLRMEELQKALAQRVFIENEDLDLCAAVSSILVNSGAEILPVLREAHTVMMQEGAARSDLDDLPGEELMAGICRCLDSMGLTSPFEGVQALLELFTLNEPEMQTALIGEMLHAEDVMLREISALMLFNPEPEVRLGVSQLLAALDGSSITPDTLRRLIVSRNWFPEEIRRNVDQAISAARKARVECAPLPKAPAITIYASPIDGSGAQSFQVVVRDGKKHFSCSILLKQGVGVADAFEIEFNSKRELQDFLGRLNTEAFFMPSSLEYLDLRICQALDDGLRHGQAPSFYLVRIAEVLGSDRWNPARLDAAAIIERLRQTLASHSPKLLSEQEYALSLQDLEEWHQYEPIFGSWFEDHPSLQTEIEAARGDRKTLTPAVAIAGILNLLEKRRELWLERIVVDTLWFKAWEKAPFAWHRIFHLASAVADSSIPLKDIPFMVSVARLSYEAYKSRSKGSRQQFGAKR